MLNKDFIRQECFLFKNWSVKSHEMCSVKSDCSQILYLENNVGNG